MKPEPIKIAFPANSRTRQDCAPLKEALELTGKENVLQSPFLPYAVFRVLRVTDIARFVRAGIFSLGIFGDDIAVENGLEIPFANEGNDGIIMGPRTLSPLVIYPKNRIVSFKGLDKSAYLTLMIREEELSSYPNSESLISAGIIATSYPTTTYKLLGRRGEILVCDGQIESLVRNQDIPRIVAGVDIVKRGETMRSFRLFPYSTLLESSPGLWKSPRVPDAKQTQVEDTICVLMERLAPFFSISN